MTLRLLTIFLILVPVLSACGETTYVDVSTRPGYLEAMGVAYITKEPISAYGIRKHSKSAVEFVTIIPSPGIDGPEVGFRTPIPIGSTLTVVGVYESNRMFDPSISLGVRVDGIALPENLPVRVDLMRGNQGTERLSLNPALFARR